MKMLLKLTLMMGLFSSLFGQTNSKIKLNIDLLINDQKQQEALSFLFKANRETPDKLKEYKSSLSKNLNALLQNSEFNYSAVNLALETSASQAFEISVESEEVLSKHNKLKRLNLRQDNDYHDWIWNNEDYMEDRADCGLILDLLGYGSSNFSLTELKESLQYFKDNRPKYFAIVGLMRRNEIVDKNQFYSVAEDNETRSLIYNHLKSNQNLYLFPEKFNNQEDLSKADMVNWLIYPTELSRVPTKIELLKIITFEFDDVGPAEFYLWKFMADDDTWKDNGWMVGLSGAFIKSETPTLDSHGYTFSAFTKLEEKTLDDHFEQIMGIMDDWYNQTN